MTENTPELRKRVQVRICLNPGQECGDGSLFYRKTRCVQAFNRHMLVTRSSTGEEKVVDSISYPTGCVCMVGKGRGWL